MLFGPFFSPLCPYATSMTACQALSGVMLLEAYMVGRVLLPCQADIVADHCGYHVSFGRGQYLSHDDKQPGDDKSVILPDFLEVAKEVTGDPQYSMFNLARRKGYATPYLTPSVPADASSSLQNLSLVS